ncbi:molybdopterin cofactor-binding domain-containing protein [Extibacter muris]|uniref:molybdopterin cofactor-binding domain-containing protein n=1 Tax=Extibacter muris TaxID=1796622 RepID=UPI001FAAD06D|nr:molybdopterin cofactor-binding domain-containing protein [Extibacter muris]MCU0080514.1 molybdopterin-dependent oxidoreductase [Extibacter muris]
MTRQGSSPIGVGMGCGSHGTYMFPFMPDVTGITMKMNEDGTIVFTTGTSDMGNGSVTTRCMMISEVLGIPLDSIAYIDRRD